MIPVTELFRLNIHSYSKKEKGILTEMKKDEISFCKYESLEEIQKEYYKRKMSP
ncbi:Uncharacterised protein [uncultured archaeon]|nr:Uncharacterised protein [uncultured archaeon]